MQIYSLLSLLIRVLCLQDLQTKVKAALLTKNKLPFELATTFNIINKIKGGDQESTVETKSNEIDAEEKEIEESGESWTRNVRRRLFLDKIALLSTALLRSDNATATVDEKSAGGEGDDDDEITQQSDLNIPNRSMVLVSTAALPWMTGTSVNPLLRAAYLCRYTRKLLTDHNLPQTQLVTLVLPWLELPKDREKVYGAAHVFQNQIEQENYIRTWLREKAGLIEEANENTGIKIIWYPARYHMSLRCIFAMGDICSLIPDSDADVCVLEEPEHLNWYRAPSDGWAKKFHYVVGVVHTNYKEYVSSQYHGLWTSPAIQLISAAMIRAYCHKVIKLSAVLQTYAPEKEEVVNVHGVRQEFLLNESKSIFPKMLYDESNQTYFIGKTLWSKGFSHMLELEDFYKQVTGSYFHIDIYGNGPDYNEVVRAFQGRKNNQISNTTNSFAESQHLSTSESEEALFNQSSKLATKIKSIQKSYMSTIESIDSFEIPKSRHEFRRYPIPSQFLGAIDHIKLSQHYKIFINPSVSEVLCTTTAEALAMGKFVIIPEHPSNAFFAPFPNALMYRTKMEFAASLRWALQHDPQPLSPDMKNMLTWQAATERFIKAAAITKREARFRAKLGKTKLDERIAFFYKELGKGVKGDAIRKVLGAGPASDQVRYTRARVNGEGEGHEGRLQQILKKRFSIDSDDSTDLEDSEQEEDGMPKKFSGSAFVKALRSSLTFEKSA